MIDELLVPLDGMTRSLDALTVAAPLAIRLGAVLSVATVADPHMDAMADVEWLERHTKDLGTELGRSVVVPADDTVATLLELADEVPNSVLCMSSHGRSGIGQTVLGSVSAAVVRASRKPVLLIGPHAEPHSTFGAVEVCLDGSDLAARAIEPGVAWAQALGAVPWLVTVEHAAVESLAGDVIAGGEVAEPAERLQARHIAAEWEVLHGPDAASALVAHAGTLDAALIVAATHGRSGLSGVVLGSVAAGIVRNARCPVLLIGPAVESKELAA